MKSIKGLVGALSVALLVSGCNMSNTTKGGLIGGAGGGALGAGLGAAIGALAGGSSGAKLGAAIGAGVGVAGGTTAGILIGNGRYLSIIYCFCSSLSLIHLLTNENTSSCTASHTNTCTDSSTQLGTT